jgi:DNA-binding HxlR family transcriptional regulator
VQRPVRERGQRYLAHAAQAERDGLVSRAVYPTIPPRVDYAVINLGRDVTALLNAVRVWSEEHINDVLAAREDYDERAAQPPQPVTA